MATIYTARVEAWNPIAAAVVPLYFSSGTGYVSRADESPASTWYEPRITQPAFMRRDAFGSRRTSGRSVVSFGELVLANPDGELDYMDAWEFDGRAVLLKIGTLTKPGAPTWTTVLSGTIQQAMFGWKSVTLRIRDRQIELDKAFQQTKYAGNNALPLGLEGVAGDLLGKPKPRLFGQALNFAPPCVNTSKLIYQVNVGAPSTFEVVTWLPTAGATLTNGNLTYKPASNPSTVRTTNTKADGKFYLEMRVDFLGSGVSPAPVGFHDGTHYVRMVSLANASGIYIGINGTNHNTGVTSFVDGDIFGAAIEIVAGVLKAWFAKNNVWMESGNPSTGANPQATIAFGSAYFLTGGTNVNGPGSEPIVTLCPDADSFVYAPPTGFAPYNETLPLPSDTLNDVDAVYDAGVALTKGAEYATEADMMATAPAVSGYRVWKSGGYFRLGSMPSGLVTADATQGQTAAARTVAQVVKAIVTGPGGISVADVSAADITTLDAANSALIGIWSGLDEMKCGDALDLATNSVGAFWGFDKDGIFRVRQLLEPTGTPVLRLSTTEVLTIERVQSKDDDRGLPAWRVALGYKRFWQTQSPDTLAGAVTAARRAELGNAYRTATAEDAAVRTIHPLAVELPVESVLVDAAAAAAEAARKLALYKERRDIYDVSFRLDGATGVVADIGDVVEITLPRYAMSGGRLMRVLGLMPDLRLGRIDMTVWG